MAKKQRPTGARPRRYDPPTCNCLLLCDDVIISHLMQKHVLQGVVGAVLVASVPAAIGPFVAYIRLSNVHSSEQIDFSFVNSEDNAVLLAFNAKSPEKSDPLGVYTFMVNIPRIPVEKEGRYLFEAKSREELLAQTPVLVTIPPQLKEQGDA